MMLAGVISDVRYFDTSKSGNTRYTFVIDGTLVFTGVDSRYSGGYIKDFEGRNVKCEVKNIRNKLTLIGVIKQ